MKVTTVVKCSIICMVISIAFSCKKPSQGIYGDYNGTMDSAGTKFTDTFNLSPGFNSGITMIEYPSYEQFTTVGINGSTITLNAQNTTENGYATTWSGSGTVSGGTINLTIYAVNGQDTSLMTFQGVQQKQ